MRVPFNIILDKNQVAKEFSCLIELRIDRDISLLKTHHISSNVLKNVSLFGLSAAPVTFKKEIVKECFLVWFKRARTLLSAAIVPFQRIRMTSSVKNQLGDVFPFDFSSTAIPFERMSELKNLFAFDFSAHGQRLGESRDAIPALIGRLSRMRKAHWEPERFTPFWCESCCSVSWWSACIQAISACGSLRGLYISVTMSTNANNTSKVSTTDRVIKSKYGWYSR